MIHGLLQALAGWLAARPIPSQRFRPLEYRCCHQAPRAWWLNELRRVESRFRLEEGSHDFEEDLGGAASNISFTIRSGSPAAEVEAAMKRAHRVARVTIYNNRLTANTLEPRGCIADWNEADERCTVYSSTQAPHTMRATIANRIFRLPERRFRIVARDVGGGFGMKGGTHPEEPMMCWASRRIGRPVKWIPDRSEGLMADDQGRDQRVTAELALDADGRFLALRWTALHNCGAYFANGGNVPISHSIKLAPSVYAIPAVEASSSMVFTNTAPTAPPERGRSA